MSNTITDSGTLLYKCRLCGKISANTHVPNIHIALSHLTSSTELPWNGSQPQLIQIHCCNNIEFGIADLIGAKKDEE